MTRNILPVLVLSSFTFFTCQVDDSEPNRRNTPKGYTLVWNDEFNDNEINTDNWNFELGDGTDYGLPKGWGNQEEQIYTDDVANALIDTDDDKSVLVIRAVNFGSNITSAKLTTEDKFGFRFGRVEVKAKMPEGGGVWPAIWTLGTNRGEEIGWPGCGEIDIVEIIGNNPNYSFSTVHFTNGKNKHEFISDGYTLPDGNFYDDYHKYTLEWTPEMITFYVDDVEVNAVEIRDDMKEFLREQYLILNVAVGGTLGGDIDPSFRTGEMKVDYIRVYSKDDMNIPEAPVLVVDEEFNGKVIDQSVIPHLLKDGFTALDESRLVVYGPQAPDFMASDTAIDGSQSTAWMFAEEGDWGGGYLFVENGMDLSSYSNLHFALNSSVKLDDAEIKLESTETAHSIFLKDYTGVDAGNGFLRYTIPMSDFADLDKTVATIPFSIWNIITEPKQKVRVLVDEVYFD
ncbi:MAG: glycoside hydrolase family 16 protein [Bacteroidia bacterium]